MKSALSKQNFGTYEQLSKRKLSKNKEKIIIRRKFQRLLENEVLLDQKIFSFKRYKEKLRKQSKWLRLYHLEGNSKLYTFQKILPLLRKCGPEQNSKISYLIPSEIFMILSPLFCDGLGKYIEKHEKYQEQRFYYFHDNSSQKQKQLLNNSPAEHFVDQKIICQGQLEEQFLTYFIKKYKEDESLKQFVYSLLKFNYFSIADIAKVPQIRNLTAQVKKGKYSSFFQLYKDGCEQLKDKLISKMIGSECQLGRYSQFSQCHNIYKPFCIKYQNNNVAILYMIILKSSDFQKKIKNRQLLGKIRRNNVQEIAYISTLYVFPKYKGIGHGKNILDILKKQGDVIVLCSSATSNNSGLEDNICNGTFYKKCQFNEYYPVQTSENEELDQGCLLQSEKEHNQCQPHRCMHPLKYYQDESFYVFDPLGRF